MSVSYNVENTRTKRGITMKLINHFSYTIYEIGMVSFEQPIFYHAPIGIRFEIGGEADIYIKKGIFRKEITNPEYLQEAYHRARTIFNILPKPFTILRIDLHSIGKELEKELKVIRDSCHLPEPTERMVQQFTLEGDEYCITSLYWDLMSTTLSIDQLLKEIIYADIGGHNFFASAVYLMNPNDKVLFHLYDDRGLDIVAQDKETLRPCYQQYAQWLLDYDREKMQKVFDS